MKTIVVGYSNPLAEFSFCLGLMIFFVVVVVVRIWADSLFGVGVVINSARILSNSFRLAR